MGLSAKIQAALSALSDADKSNLSKCWDAIGAVLDELSPPGTIKMHGGGSAPTGYLLCDGSAVSRTTYADLFSVIGTTFGIGDGSSTFNLPDFRGIFPRGAGTNGTLQDAQGNYFNGTLGSSNNDQFQGHYHQAYNHDVAGGTEWGSTSMAASYKNQSNSRPLNNWVKQPITDGTNGTPRTGAETNPANLAVNFIIKT